MIDDAIIDYRYRQWINSMTMEQTDAMNSVVLKIGWGRYGVRIDSSYVMEDESSNSNTSGGGGGSITSQ